MKSAPSVFGAVAIALVSGMAGFFIGNKQSAFRTAPAPVPAGAPESAVRFGKTARSAVMEKTALRELRSSLDRETDPLARFNLALKSLEAWMNTEPKAALDWLNSQQRSARRDEVIRKALGQFAESDPKGAAEWAMANLTGADLNNNLILIAEQWARQNGSEAASWLSARPATKERDAAMENLFFAWASENPTAALDFIGKNPGAGDLAAILRYATFAGWAKTDPQSAVTASLQSSRTFQDPAQFANTLANWATMDLAACSQWFLANIKDGPERAPAVEELATIFARQSPDAGLAWLGKLNAGTERETALNQLAATWASSDPASAAKWATSQTVGTLNQNSVDQILHNFFAQDGAAYNTWRTTLPPGPLKTQADQLTTDVGEGE